MTQCSYSKTWVTVDLHNRSVGACCRTTQHDVSGAIDINNEWFTSLRKNLNSGIEDPRCSACWQQEKSIGTSLRSNGPIMHKWSKTESLVEDADLQYLEIRLGNQCDGACVYCGGNFSVKQAKFWKIHLDMPKPVVLEPLINETKQLIEQNKHSLNTIVFIGGEPSMMEKWYEFIDSISEINFSKNLTVVVTTNMNWTEKTKERLFVSMEKFLLNKGKTFNIRISGEGDEKYFRGIRKFSDYDKVLSNTDAMVAQFGDRITYTLQPVLNGLSVYSLDDWLTKYTGIFENRGISNVGLHFAMLTRPIEFQTIHQGEAAVPSIDKILSLIESNNIFTGKESCKRILENQKSKLIGHESDVAMLDKLAATLRAHDRILPHDWKSEDALSQFKRSL